VETYQHFGLYREVWWRLTIILGYIVKSGGDLPTFLVIGEVWWRLTNIFGNIVKSGGDLPTFLVI